MSLVETKYQVLEYFMFGVGKTKLVINELNKLPVIEVTSTRGRNMNTHDLGLGLLNDVT